MVASHGTSRPHVLVMSVCLLVHSCDSYYQKTAHCAWGREDVSRNLNGSIYLRGSDIACLVEGAADSFNNVYKDFISPATISPLSVQHRLDNAGGAFANCVEKRRRCCFPLHARFNASA